MAGFDLKEGTYEKRLTSDDELWSALACVFSSKSRNDSSYKYGFLKSIIDNLYNVDADLKLSFDQLFSKFGEIYWNLILKHGLRQKAITQDKRETYLEQVLHGAVKKYQILEPIPYESLTSEMMLDITHQVKVKCKKYVVGALYEDTNRLFYSFSKKDEWIQINPVMYEFVCKHKVVIEKLNYYEWARFLEKVNEETNAIKLLSKIDESAKRNNLSMYRRILYEEFENKTCFYCGKQLNPESIDVDHFIPWSFIKDDKIWNLVLTCPTCNRKKNDKLPAGDYLAELVNRNKQIMIETHQYGMKNYQDRMVSYVYNWAKINGYDKTWKPDVGKERFGMSEKKQQRKWVREEVVILVTEYFRTKNFSTEEISKEHQRISDFLRRREEILTGESVSDIFRDYAGIHMQSGRIRCLDPENQYSGMKGTKLQKEIVQEYLQDSQKMIEEAKMIYAKYQ